jgi:hypothetical protein
VFDHQAKGLGETEDRIRRFTARVREVLDREKRAVNIIVAINQQELHGIILGGMDRSASRERCKADDKRCSRLSIQASTYR